MKKHDDVENPYALANYMKKKGAKPGYSSRKPHGKKKS
jgi:LAS superfamily LD-carboxypeptidase LdcB